MGVAQMVIIYKKIESHLAIDPHGVVQMVIIYNKI